MRYVFPRGTSYILDFAYSEDPNLGKLITRSDSVAAVLGNLWRVGASIRGELTAFLEMSLIPPMPLKMMTYDHTHKA